MFNREKLEVKRVPMMPVRDMVIFPEMMHPFIVGREASVRALEEALAGDKKIFPGDAARCLGGRSQARGNLSGRNARQHRAEREAAGRQHQSARRGHRTREDRSGDQRRRVFPSFGPPGHFKAEPSPQLEQASSRVTGLFEQYVKLSQSLNYDTMIAAVRVEDAGKLSDAIAANLQIPVEEKQELLELFEPLERLNRIADILEVEIEKLNVDRSINTRVKRQMERAQKEYYLNEKLKAIQKELGRGEANEIEQLKKKIETSGMPEGPQEKAMQELKRLEMMPPMSAESTVSRNYLDWLLAVPWKKRSKEIRDIKTRRADSVGRPLRP